MTTKGRLSVRSGNWYDTCMACKRLRVRQRMKQSTVLLLCRISRRVHGLVVEASFLLRKENMHEKKNIRKDAITVRRRLRTTPFLRKKSGKLSQKNILMRIERNRRKLGVQKAFLSQRKPWKRNDITKEKL